MNIQVTLTPSESKRLIAKAIASLPKVKSALKSGSILLKGGTTVSALAEELVGVPLRISGRISARGTLAAGGADRSPPHSMLVERGKGRNVDDRLLEAARGLGPGDVVVIGANAIDAEGNAAMMAGSAGGLGPGEAMVAFSTEGAEVIVAAGLEKLVPGKIRDAIAAAGRKTAGLSLGMAVGLMPVTGRLFTELEAFAALADVKAAVIGKGGILGGEGSTVFAIEGPALETERVFDLVLALKGAPVSGVPGSLEECTGPNPWCANHLACWYKAGGKKKARKTKK